MSPTLLDGDLALVDQGCQSVCSGYLYLVKIEEAYSVNRLILKPGKSLLLVSDNQALSPPFELPNSQLEIIGQVIWVARAL